MENPLQKETTEASKNLLTSERVHKDVLASEKAQKEKRPLFRVCLFLTCGIFNTILGIITIRYNFVELLMEERIKMRPGLPPYELWRNPPVSVILSVTIFNVTNAIEFLDGLDEQLKLEEVGPIYYAETVEQKDIVYHYENSTMSFTTERTITFLPDRNEPGILNKSLIVINPTLLGLAAYLHDSSFVQKFAFRLLASSDNVFVRQTVYEALWNSTSPMLDRLSTSILSFLVPRNNSGILYNAFYPKVSRFNVKVGIQNGFEDFFKINTFNGMPNIPGFESERRPSCPVVLVGAREGANLPPYMSKSTVLTVWREDVCTTVNFVFEEEVDWNGIKAYRFKIPANSFERSSNESEDCRRGQNSFPLPSGLVDGSKCSFGVPTAVSFPHYYGSDGFFTKYVNGIKPDEEKHGSYAIIEPTTGFPLEEIVRMQNSLVIPKLEGYNEDIQRFSNKIFPCFWVEYSMTDLPSQIAFATKFIVIYIPIIQMLLIITLLTLGAGFSYFGIVYLFQIDPYTPRNILISKMSPFRVKNVTKSTVENKI